MNQMSTNNLITIPKGHHTGFFVRAQSFVSEISVVFAILIERQFLNFCIGAKDIFNTHSHLFCLVGLKVLHTERKTFSLKNLFFPAHQKYSNAILIKLKNTQEKKERNEEERRKLDSFPR